MESLWPITVALALAGNLLIHEANCAGNLYYLEELNQRLSKRFSVKDNPESMMSFVEDEFFKSKNSPLNKLITKKKQSTEVYGTLVDLERLSSKRIYCDQDDLDTIARCDSGLDSMRSPYGKIEPIDVLVQHYLAKAMINCFNRRAQVLGGSTYHREAYYKISEELGHFYRSDESPEEGIATLDRIRGADSLEPTEISQAIGWLKSLRNLTEINDLPAICQDKGYELVFINEVGVREPSYSSRSNEGLSRVRALVDHYKKLHASKCSAFVSKRAVDAIKLLSSTDLDAMKTAAQVLFHHLNRNLNQMPSVSSIEELELQIDRTNNREKILSMGPKIRDLNLNENDRTLHRDLLMALMENDPDEEYSSAGQKTPMTNDDKYRALYQKYSVDTCNSLAAAIKGPINTWKWNSRSLAPSSDPLDAVLVLAAASLKICETTAVKHLTN